MNSKLIVTTGRGITLALLLVAGFGAFRAAAQNSDSVDEAWLRANYTKAEHSIAMRDGVKLYTAVYAPKDLSTNCPIWMTRTPYGAGPYGADTFPSPKGPFRHFAREKFIFVFQDVRGRFSSEGEFAQVRPLKAASAGKDETDESTDTWDTVDWLVKNVPKNNGRVGLSGVSYPGFYAACGAVNSHPALKAISPQAPVGDWFIGDDYHRNGALYLSKSFGSGLNAMVPKPVHQKVPRIHAGTRDGYEYYLHFGPLETADTRTFDDQPGFWHDIVTHGNYDEFWQTRNPCAHLTNVNAAILVVGGWFDAEDLYGALTVYRAIGRQNPNTENFLAMGPWSHGLWQSDDAKKFGPLKFGENTSGSYQTNIELPFFNHYLKGDGKSDLPKASVFETGGNRWRRFDAWPPTNVKATQLYFHANGRLTFSPPTEGNNAFDEYVSDPNKPVPFLSEPAMGMPREYMVGDQRFAATRPDVLVYQTEPLKESITVAGPVLAQLKVSTTGTDSDWIVKLIDVYPAADTNSAATSEEVDMDGYQMLVRGEPMRGKFRNSFSKPEPFKPGKIAGVEWPMSDVCHTFRAGHRIMVQVQSSWFPLFDRNPQVFCDIYRAKPEDFKKATQRVYRTRNEWSGVQVNILP